MVDPGGQTQTIDVDELLVKGEDGKFYMLRGETLVPIEESVHIDGDDVSSFVAHAAAVPALQSSAESITEVLRLASVAINDAVIRSRLEKTLTLFYKDLRNRLETKETLMRSPKVGGCGLTEMQVDQLLKIADTKRSEWLQAVQPVSTAPRPPSVVPAAAPRPAVPAAPVFEKMNLVSTLVVEKKKEVPVIPVTVQSVEQVSVREEVKKIPPPPNLPIVIEAAVAKSVVPVPLVPKATRQPVVQPAVPVVKKVSVPPRPAITPQEPVKQLPEKIVRTPVTAPVVAVPEIKKSVGRPLIMDVTPPPTRAVGPVEELRYDLSSYRRLGNAKEAAERVFEKMTSLFRSSWREGMDGLQAWKESPVMRCVDMASQQSMSKNVPVATVIQNAMQRNVPTVTPEEWQACIELLQRIDRFIQGGK